MRTLVTGATGFIGTALVQRLLLEHEVVAAYRTNPPRCARVTGYQVGTLTKQTDWGGAFDGVDCVVHLAARVHVMHDRVADSTAEYRRVNVEGSVELARQAARADVRRFIYVSSIKVNGESTVPGRPFTADDVPRPQDPYGISKHEAEQALAQVAAATGMELVVVRPPLVYGPGVRANFRSMMVWLERGIPLPFGAIDNRRSLVSLDNLSDLLATCVRHPAAAGQTFLAGDGEDVSTSQLLAKLSRALGRRPRLVSVPPVLLESMFGLFGKRAVAQRLVGSLQVDIGPARARLDWKPPIGLDEGLRRTAAAFRAEGH